MFEELLVQRLSERYVISRLVTHATRRLVGGATVRAVVDETGYSHRRFIEIFKSGVGLTPKAYGRLVRFQRAVEGLSQPGMLFEHSATCSQSSFVGPSSVCDST